MNNRDLVAYELPAPVSGAELNPNFGFFSVVIPEETTNLVTNPSVEGSFTTGYTAVAGTIAATNNWQAYGATGLQITPAVSTESGAYFGTVSLISGTTYTFSVTIQGEENKIYYLWFATTAGALLGGKRRYIGTGKKQRISVTYTEVSTTTRRVYVTRDAKYTDTNLFYADGFQVEAKAYPTTFCDGEQQGFVVGQPDYLWNGTPRASTSTRSSQSRSGGREYNLLDLGLRISAIVGLGMSPLVDQAAPIPGFGKLPQGTGTMERDFVLIGTLYSASGRHLQAMRSVLVDAFKPDIVTYNQPMILRYQAVDEDGIPYSESVDLVCKYIGGLEGSWDSNTGQKIALSFRMHIPFIKGTYENGALLGYTTTLSFPSCAVRGPDGIWSNMGGGGVGPAGTVMDWAEGPDQRIYLGGAFTNLTDANGDLISVWNGTAYASLGTGGVGPLVQALEFGPDGTLYAGGNFTGMGGIANTDGIAKWSGGLWSALGTGISSGTNEVNGLVYSNHRVMKGLYAVGQFDGMGGVALTDSIARWTTVGTWVSVGGGITSGQVFCVTTSKDGGTIYIGGSFLVGGSAASVARYSGVAWEIVGNANGAVEVLLFGTDGTLYAGGSFTSIDGVACNRIAKYNGTSWQPLGAGLQSILSVNDIALDNDTGIIYVGGTYGATGSFPDQLWSWNGSVFAPMDINLPGSADVESVFLSKSKDLYIGFDTDGNGQVATVTIPVVGSAAVYPTIVFTGPGTLWQLKNYTSGKAIYFDGLELSDGEVATLVLEPGNISFVSTVRGNVMNFILPGSDLSLSLLPGNNNISTFLWESTSAATNVVMYWNNQYWSLDGAAFQ